MVREEEVGEEGLQDEIDGAGGGEGDVRVQADELAVVADFSPDA